MTGPDTAEPETGSAAAWAGVRWPDGFWFGVCTSAYHSEGGFNQPGGPHNQWAEWEQRGQVEVSGDTNRLWADPAPYIRAAAALDLNTFRLGFEWARVQPSFGPGLGPPPAWDPAALDQYADLVGQVQAAGLAPVVTLHHFTQPAWVGPDLFLHDHLVEHLLAYMLRVVDEVGTRLVAAGRPPVGIYVTFNEPFNAAAGPYLAADHPPGRRGDRAAYSRAIVRLLRAHARAYDLIHDLHARRGWPPPQVGFNFVSFGVYAIDQIWPDLMRARERGVPRAAVMDHLAARRARFEAVYGPLARARFNAAEWPHWQAFKARCEGHFEATDFGPLLDDLYASARPRKLDYLALDYYDPFWLGTPPPDPATRAGTEAEPKDRLAWWEWRFDPEVLRAHLRLHGQDADDLPLYILETSWPHGQPKFGPAWPRPDGLTRSQFLRGSLRVVAELLREGLPLRGYLYWTLTDNYEWGSFTPRLGLLEYDHAAHVIRDTDGLGDPAGATFRALIRALRSGDPATLAAAFGPA